MGKSSNKGYYWVARGHRPGIYEHWSTPPHASPSSSSTNSTNGTNTIPSLINSSILCASDAVKGYPNGLYAKASTLSEAIKFMIEAGASKYLNNGTVNTAANNNNNNKDNNGVPQNKQSNDGNRNRSSTMEPPITSLSSQNVRVTLSSSSSTISVNENDKNLPQLFPSSTATTAIIIPSAASSTSSTSSSVIPAATTILSSSKVVVDPILIDLTNSHPNNHTTTVTTASSSSRKRSRNNNDDDAERNNNISALLSLGSSLPRNTNNHHHRHHHRSTTVTVESAVPNVVDASLLLLPSSSNDPLLTVHSEYKGSSSSNNSSKRLKSTTIIPLPKHSLPYTAVQPHRYFSSVPNTPSSASASYSTDTWLLQFDGGSRGNPGIGGCGSLLYKLQNNWEQSIVGHSIKTSLDRHLLYTESHPSSSSSSSFVTMDGESIPDNYKQLMWSYGRYFPGPISNNQAEYAGLYLGIQAAQHFGIRRLIIEGDSDLIIKQVCGKYMCTKDHLRIFVTEIQKLLGVYIASSAATVATSTGTTLSSSSASTTTTTVPNQRIVPSNVSSTTFECVTLRHIFRTHNSQADSLANEAMDKKQTIHNNHSTTVPLGQTFAPHIDHMFVAVNNNHNS